MIACVKSKVGVSENKPWRLGALAVCQVHLPVCVKSKVGVSENKPWRLGALAVCHTDSFLINFGWNDFTWNFSSMPTTFCLHFISVYIPYPSTLISVYISYPDRGSRSPAMLKVLGVCVSDSGWSAETTLACWVAGFIIVCLATRWLAGSKKTWFPWAGLTLYAYTMHPRLCVW